MQVGCSGNTDVGCGFCEGPEIIAINAVKPAYICYLIGHKLRCHFPKFSGWISIGIFHNTFDIGGRVDAGQFKHLAAGIE